MIRTILIFIFVLLTSRLFAQPTQSIRGTVVDIASNYQVSNASVQILNTATLFLTTTDSLGNFIIQDVPVGRYDLQVTYSGYEPTIIREILVIAGKQTILNIQLKEKVTLFGNVVFKPRVNKEQSPNSTATVSARTLSVEESKRYAGGFDDPARLASSFAGVSSNTGENGIIVRGNAPKFVQWKMEGIEIPNPNHFGNLISFGGGTFTALSSQMLANSGFYTGAFPAEYNNALSGVFDISMRNGNNQKRENTLQFGLVGIDASSEGPFKKGGKASYLFNYRYSTLALLAPLLPEGSGSLKYQDLSFKLNFPTQKAGTFSIWGIGLLDRANSKAKTDSSEWKYYNDKNEDEIKLFMGAAGINHKYSIKKGWYLKSSLATTVSGTEWSTSKLNEEMTLNPYSTISSKNWNFVFSSSLNRKFSSKHSNKTGLSATGMMYDILLKNSTSSTGSPQEIVNEKGFSTLLSAYSNSTLNISSQTVLNLGVNAQLFTLNNHYTIEPRLGIRHQIGKKQSVGFAYGLHSRLEQINYYFNNSLATGEKAVNKDLDFTKAQHFVLSYDKSISDVLHLKIEPYFQYLYSVPVIADSSFTFINLKNDWFFAEKLQNTGEGRNYGLDITIEKYVSKGYYYLLTASVFNSETKAGDGVWRSTRFNRNYAFNFLIGKEWKVGQNKQNTLSLNTRLSYQGGYHYSPVNEEASRLKKEVVFNETQANKLQIQAALNAHFTASYKVNKKNSSRELALKIINVTGQSDFNGFKYNLLSNKVEKDLSSIIIPNLSYKIEF